ncbi:unnamed protein product [Rotaria sordida]|uniref:Uncharacterized protein n=1 Tax=Rotaria sordida TaxID=392033 RepID=A0A818ZKK4_9BILA|nr:unnamed protein product [Rotaria sordida]CAF3811888.1 unnamed protein product [Rotaria sordida]CAF3952537.1 unnamed protein product [Rotaria sordida]
MSYIEFDGLSNFEAMINSDYNNDSTGIYWIGYDDYLRKVNSNNVNLLDDDITRDGNPNNVFHRKQNTNISFDDAGGME